MIALSTQLVATTTHNSYLQNIVDELKVKHQLSKKKVFYADKYSHFIEQLRINSAEINVELYKWIIDYRLVKVNKILDSLNKFFISIAPI